MIFVTDAQTNVTGYMNLLTGDKNSLCSKLKTFIALIQNSTALLSLNKRVLKHLLVLYICVYKKHLIL